MNNTQLYLAIVIPTVAVLSSLIVSLVQISGVRNEIGGLRNEMYTMRDMLRAEIALGFERILAKLEAHELEHHRR